MLQPQVVAQFMENSVQVIHRDSVDPGEAVAATSQASQTVPEHKINKGQSSNTLNRAVAT